MKPKLITGSRLVRRFKPEVRPCPNCGLQPVEVTRPSPIGVVHHSFQCPECDDPHTRWEFSHQKAAEVWNAQRQTR